jgi:hypothetical protein
MDRYTFIEASSDPIGSRLIAPRSAPDYLPGEDDFMSAQLYSRV